MHLTTTVAAGLLFAGVYAGLDFVVDGMAGTMIFPLKGRAVGSNSGSRKASLPNINATVPQASQLDIATWNKETSAACNEALSKLDLASNPSGTCVCYNIPVLNNDTGAFEADLRLYQLSEPTGVFAGVPAEKIMVVVKYPNAEFGAVDEKSLKRRALTPGRRGELRLLQQYFLKGQINRNIMQGSMDQLTMEALVLPTITLTGVNLQGQTISTNVSSNEAVFVNGEFSNAVFMSDVTKAQFAVDDMVLALKNGTVAFVMPGVTLLVFPIGLIIASVWMAIGIAVIGFTTYERIQYRDRKSVV